MVVTKRAGPRPRPPLFFGFGGGVDFGEEFGGVGLEVVDAAFAADEDDAVGLAGGAVDIGGGLAHAAEGLVGNEAGFEGVGGAGFGDRLGFGGGGLFGGGGARVVVVFVGGEQRGREAGGEGENEGGEEGVEFHEDGSGALNRRAENPAENCGKVFGGILAGVGYRV